MARVIGIGDNVVDKYLDLNTMFPGGNALNFAVYARKLGHEAAYIGVFGNDQAAEHIRTVLQELGVELSFCRIYPGENGYAEVNLVKGERVFVGGNKGGVAKDNPLLLTPDDLTYISGFDLMHSSCYSLLEDQLFKLQKLEIPLSFDFSDRISDDYLEEVCPFLDFAFLSGSGLSTDQIKEKLVKAVGCGCQLALATRGSAGVILLADGQFYQQPAFPIDPLDTLGAGDSFITYFLLQISTRSWNKPDVLTRVLREAAQYAAGTCLVQGAFGYGREIHPK